MSFLKHAQHLAAKGFFVFPLVSNGKTPVIKEYTECATDNANDLKKFWYDSVLEIEHSFNIGIATSSFHGGEALLVVDVDNKGAKHGSDELLKLELKGFLFPPTLTQKTPTGGYHLIYKVKTPVKQGTDVLGPGLDIRSKGGYIVGYGSIIDEKAYIIHDSKPIAKCPQWLIAKCKEASKREIRTQKPSKAISQKTAITRGQEYLLNGGAPLAIEGAHGDQTTFIVANKLKDIGLSLDNCFDLLSSHWNEKCQPPWSPDELKQKIENAYAYGQNVTGSDSPEADFKVINNKKLTVKKQDPILELNKEFAFIVIGGKSTILRQNKKGEVSYMNVQSFHDLLKARTIQIGTGKRKQLSELWFSSDKRATYNSVELLPCKEAPPGVFNLWRGFNCEPLDKKDTPTKNMVTAVDMFKEHVFENICSSDNQLYIWLFSYLAHLIQKPWEKARTALVLKGKKGIGKNVFIDCIGNLFGSHYLLTSKKRYLTSNFNKHLSNLVLFVLDEAFWSGDKEAEGILKDLITGNSHLLEQKGREMYKAENVLRVCIIGNEDWVIPASDDERRYAVFNVGDSRRNDIPFFSKMVRLLTKKGGNKLLMRELLDFDLSTVNINIAPNTIGLLEQKIESLNPIHSWWLSSLKEGAVLNFDFSDDNWPQTVDRDHLRLSYISYAKTRGIRSWLPDSASFKKHLNKIVPGLTSKRLREKGARQRVYALPSLNESREQFEFFIGQEMIWEDVLSDNVIDAVSILS